VAIGTIEAPVPRVTENPCLTEEKESKTTT